MARQRASRSRTTAYLLWALGLVVPILLATAWYEHDRLARDVRRIEEAVRQRVELSREEGEG